jgi:hypothetical protein
VQAFPSSQGVFSGRLTFVQPVAGTQLSSVQTLLSLQFSAAPGRHTPLWQLSFCVQTLLSLQGASFGRGVSAGHVSAPPQVSARSHCPAAGRHTVSEGTAWLKSHVPLTQRSTVQGLRSLQAWQMAAPAPHRVVL